MIYWRPLHDGAQFPCYSWAHGLPLQILMWCNLRSFLGGNIGKLAVCGTVNDLAMNGAIPQYLSCGLIFRRRFGL